MTMPKVAQPLANPWTPLSSRIIDITEEMPGTLSYELVFDDHGLAESFRFQPGQFNMLYLPGFGESAISISSDPTTRGSLVHTVRIAGNVTGALSRLEVGDQLLLRGPFGSSWPLSDCAGQDVVIAAGGIGLAPLRPAIYQIIKHRQDYGRVCLLYGARTPADLLYPAEYDRWRESGVEVTVTVDAPDTNWRGHIGVVPKLIDGLPTDTSRTRVLTCGPEIMMRFVIFEFLTSKVAPDRIFLSLERNMNCAIGFCGHCQLGPAFVCKDGPVFSFERMEPYLNLEDL